MKSIYLFTNVNAGRQFIAIAAQFARIGSCRCVVVLSSRNWLKLEGLDWYKHLIKMRLVAMWFSLHKNVTVHITTDINLDSFFAQVTPEDSGIVAGFDQIFSTKLIERFGNLINFHLSLLPFYRGPLPTYWCLQNNESKTGITLHHVSTEIDCGEIIHQQVEAIEAGDEEWTLRSRLWQKAQPLFRAWLCHLVDSEEFEGRTVDARSIYKVPVDYQSFP